MGEDPQQLRAEIAQTRAELGQDLDNLVEKVSPSKVVERKVDATKEAVMGLKDKVMGSASSAKDSVMGTVGSAGAVFMGANTYIGNAPNFMVKAIAEENGAKMPSFFGYMVFSGLVLIPIFILVTILFFR